MKVSKAVQKWLESGVSDEIRRMIRNQGINVELADAWMRGASKLLQGQGACFHAEKLHTNLLVSVS